MEICGTQLKWGDKSFYPKKLFLKEEKNNKIKSKRKRKIKPKVDKNKEIITVNVKKKKKGDLKNWNDIYFSWIR